MVEVKYVLISIFSIITSLFILSKLRRDNKLKYIPLFFWLIVSIALLTDGKNLQLSIGIITSSFLILFMDGSTIFWNRKFDKKFIKNSLLWIGIIAILYISNIRINFITTPNGTYMYFSTLSSILLTTLWLLLIVNSIKFTSILPGLTSAFTFIISLIFFVIAAAQKQNLDTALILSLTLSIISMSTINYEFKYPYLHLEKRLNLFYGFLLGIISIAGMLKSSATIAIIIPAILLSIPIIDTSYAFVSSFILGKPKNFFLKKIANQIEEKKIPKNKIPILVYSIGAYLALSSFILYIYPNGWIGILLFSIGGVFLYNKLGTIEKEKEINIQIEKKLNVLGVPVDRVTLSEAVRKIESFLLAGGSHVVVTPDSLAILIARRDKEYKKILLNADLVTPDGIGLLLASKIMGAPIKERVTGIDIINRLFEVGNKRGYKFYFLGAEKGVSERAKEKILKKFPGINIVGVHHGYLQEEENKRVINDIIRKKPDILLVGMGVPKQEKWIYKNLNMLQVPVCIGVGGSFDVLSGKLPRAPKWMQKGGIEWVYRVLKEPKRIKRVIKIPYFLLLIFLKGISVRLLKRVGE